MQRGSEFSIMLGSNELMNSRLSGSEQALATLACGSFQGVGPRRILIGGLGMGFTLRSALALLDGNARVDVAELMQSVVDWARGPMADVFGGSLDDRRVHLLVRDVAAVIADSAGIYDAILLDVDNGPDGLTIAANDRLYNASGLMKACVALRPGGVLAVWSARPDDRFTLRLRQAGFAVDEKIVRANGARGGAKHTIWLASRQA
jgi:spermidine synthase